MHDRGSSSHLIVGEIAETENLQILSARDGCIQVAGGHKVSTDYGLYRAVEDPSTSGEYFGLNCQGIAKIAGDLKEQSLNEVNTELRRSGLINPDTLLPEYAGGGPLELLIRIQDVQLDPVLVAVLPSGIGVYKCPFIDVWGSNLAYAGPHPSFQTSLTSPPTSSLLVQFPTSPRQSKKFCKKKWWYRRNPVLCPSSPAPGGGCPRINHRHRTQQQSPRLTGV